MYAFALLFEVFVGQSDFNWPNCFNLLDNITVMHTLCWATLHHVQMHCTSHVSSSCIIPAGPLSDGVHPDQQSLSPGVLCLSEGCSLTYTCHGDSRFLASELHCLSRLMCHCNLQYVSCDLYGFPPDTAKQSLLEEASHSFKPSASET